MPSLVVSWVLLMWLAAPTIAATQSACEQSAALVNQALNLGDNPEALPQQQALLAQATAVCPENATAQHNLGVIYEQQGQFELALTHYRRALELQPNAVPPWLGIGDVLYAQGQYPLSLVAYLNICAQDGDARRKIGELLRDQRYKTVAPGAQLDRASLALLYNRSRLAELQQQAMNCQQQFKSVADAGATKAIMVPVVIFRNLQFAVGDSEPTPETLSQLDAMAAVLVQDLPEVTVRVDGHTDSQPFQGVSPARSRARNRQLSANRATAVVRALIQRRVDPSRLRSQGFGQEVPLVQGEDAGAWAQNRRVEIEVE